MIKQVMMHEARNMFKSRWLLIFFVMLFVMSAGVFELSENSTKVFSSLISLVVQFIPLAAIIMGTVTYYSSKEFIIMLLALPQKRSKIYFGILGGMALPTSCVIIAGISIPALLFGEMTLDILFQLLRIMAAAVQLALVFLSLSMLISVTTEERGQAIGACFFLWILFAVLYDGIILLAAINFSGYPLELPVLFLSGLNPIDLARILLLLHSDNVAMMGYTGRVYQQFLGSSLGFAVTLTLQVLWIVLPVAVSRQVFVRKDF